MKLFLLATIALAFPGTSSVVAKGDSRPFGSKSSKTRKSQHGVFAAKAAKTVPQSIVTDDESAPLIINGTSSPIDDEGRHPKNSEDGGLVLDGTGDASGSEAVEEEEEDDALLNETFGDDDVSPSTQGFDPTNDAMFEWLKGCAEADLDKDTCLVTKTLDSLVNVDGQSQDDDATFSSKRRVLQEEGCRPDMSEQDLRYIMNGSRADCMQVAIGYSDEVFEGMFMEFWKVLSSDNCWNELCESPDIFLRLMFDHAVKCANVDFDVDHCIMDQIFSMMFAEPAPYDDDDYYYATDDSLANHTHRVLRSLQDVVNGDTAADCVEVNEVDLAFMASFVLMEAQGRCAELGLLVSSEDISKASADLVQLFASPHCWGDVHACPEVVADDDDNNYVEEEEEDDALLNEPFDDDDVSPTTQGFDPTNDAMFEWLKGCAGADLDKDTCLVTKTLDSLVNMDGQSRDGDSTFPSKRRVLQEEGCRPDMSEQDVRNIMNGSRAACNQVAIGYSDEVFEGMFMEFWKVFSADSCWNELCESPDIFFKLMFDHAMQCANVEFDVDECVTDQIFSIMFAGPDSYDDDDDYYYATDDGLTNNTHRLLRSLQDVMNGESEADCVEVNEVELAFFASFILMEAQGHCDELGVLVTTEAISKASTDLVKLFASPHCWGDVPACPESEEEEVDDDNIYVDVLEPNEVGNGNITSLANDASTPSETTSTQPAGISPPNEDVATVSNDDGDSYEADDDTNTNGDGVLNNGTAGIMEEDNISLSVIEEGDITDVNHTSVEGGINATWATDDDHLSVAIEGDVDEASTEEDANDSSTKGGVNGTSTEKDLSESALEDANDSSNNGQEEDNVTSIEEDHLSASTDDDINGVPSTEVEGQVNGTFTEEDPFSTFIPPENGTTPIFNSSTSENTTIPSSSDNSTGSIFTTQVTGESCDVGPRSGSSERSIQMPYYYIIETIVLEGVADEIEGMLHLMMCINGVDRRLSVVSGETSIVALESSPKDVVSTQCKLLLPLCLSMRTVPFKRLTLLNTILISFPQTRVSLEAKKLKTAT
eukprot:scaffold10642_cov155-Skeletonema_dohrnii-CCMP3373.AAC.3